MHLKAFGVAFLCCGVPVSVRPAVAHHSHGNYDLTTWTVMEGTVKQVVFIVPHSIVYLDVKARRASRRRGRSRPPIPGHLPEREEETSGAPPKGAHPPGGKGLLC